MIQIGFINQWGQKGDFDILDFGVHDCDKDFGVFFRLFGLGMIVLFGKY